MVWFSFMKTVILSLILSFPLFLNGDDEPIDDDRLEQREVNGEVLLFIVDSKTPFTGTTVGIRYENGQKRSALSFKAGKQDGLSTSWYKNGQKKDEGYMTDVKYSGSYKSWYENGQKESEINFKDGEWDGLNTRWHENGQKKTEINFKDGEMDGLSTTWHENGQKKSEGIFNEDKPDGVHIQYDKTGKETWRTSYFQGIIKSVLKSP